ncbi:related to heterokaryon incompatibility protein (het-6OR allele) [Fusarium fujikuroi IMI 58289]|uniref:Related to heterokaryon incompatibility protein (Het-6OR allele) n=1 Tax=Gibberella fujikuroi (strain CBS 195.34 / IMI 58289 / NRRL A-6831) TaxID=1279085 RepID=S0E6Z0_GIBF5|nr:related to heterokaryon incompatibility protein (het-6OR allele) [Fusarium fujikuroi IMI 58289]CCT70581.1 related to heterokaryon incompatibility protein (het-6OR allele) [Fusarium fujikuroi IMI 58289]SCN83453.1 related to heterokaryon incompatibility protein (het-6OR allele) [Fusarium fujikuroi]SCN86254.1 related to heterokaryon incompatibility protein (het-6OR allele) [Fusarium fujikuroi]SCO48088.1 related to heterokaryon incompatibility protein (het-6OR allele) [Fusarium fujikuroi]
MSSDIFQYKPLEHRHSFRLLHLEPSLDHSADLKGWLHHATLSDYNYDLIEPYTSLSYVWGDASHKGVIHLGGRAMEITASLDAALSDMRDRSRVFRNWADALCIVQSNNTEKGVQVAIMGRIYSTAHHTVIHLGKSPQGFEKLVKDLKQGQPQNLTPLEDMNSGRYGAFFEAPLSKILSCRRGIGATDPRDIIFGHLNVVSGRDRCDRFIKVDYDRDLAHVWVDAARHFLDAPGIESLLLHAMNLSPFKSPEIPSWCPRWSRL